MYNSRMNNVQNRIDRTRKIITYGMIASIILTVVGFGAVVYLYIEAGTFIVENPEAIGEFIGKINKGIDKGMQ